MLFHARVIIPDLIILFSFVLFYNELVKSFEFLFILDIRSEAAIDVMSVKGVAVSS